MEPDLGDRMRAHCTGAERLAGTSCASTMLKPTRKTHVQSQRSIPRHVELETALHSDRSSAAQTAAQTGLHADRASACVVHGWFVLDVLGWLSDAAAAAAATDVGPSD